MRSADQGQKAEKYEADQGIKEKLEEFLTSNPEAKLNRIQDSNVVRDPWRDSSLVISFKDHEEDVIDCLNRVYLPPQYTAIWHKAERSLEVIYTAFPVPDEVRKRDFVFSYCDNDFRCHFGDSSPALLLISRHAVPVEPPTSTDHRNLMSFNAYQDEKGNGEDTYLAKEGRPTSFWIENIDWNDDFVNDMVRNLNFYMSYYDSESPAIIIHANSESNSKIKSANPLILGEFPEKIKGRPLDDFLLTLWSTAQEADPARRFLYNYQVIEYGAFYHLDDNLKRTVRRLMAQPHAVNNPDRTAQQMLDAFVEGKLDETQKFESVVRSVVNPEVVWREIEPNKEYFCEVTEFEGGFKLPALLKKGWQYDDFLAHWIPAYPNTLRKIRNALVHAREMRQVSVIAPTRENFRKLRPWIGPISATADEIILYREIG